MPDNVTVVTGAPDVAPEGEQPANVEVQETTATITEPAVAPEAQGEKKPLDLRKFGFQQQARAKKAETENSELKAILERNTKAFEALVGKMGTPDTGKPVVSTPVQPENKGTPPKQDEHAGFEWLFGEKPPQEEPKPAPPQPVGLTLEQVQKLVAEALDKQTERLRAESNVAQGVLNMEPLLTSLCAGKSNEETAENVRAAAERIRNACIKTGLPPHRALMADEELGFKLIQNQLMVGEQKGREAEKAERKLYVEKKGIHPSAVGLAPAPEPSPVEKRKAEELEVMKAHPEWFEGPVR